jgi:hypothetical protein
MLILLPKLIELAPTSPYKQALYERDAIEMVSNLCAC